MPIISLLKADGELATSAKAADLLMRRLLLPLGGPAFYFCPGEKLTLFADVSLPADNELGANFDIRLLWALINIAREEGVSDITVCIRPEESFDLQTVLDKTSYGKLVGIEGVKVVGVSAANTTYRKSDSALVLEDVAVYNEISTADIIISLAKFKTAEDKLFGSALANMSYAAEMDDSLSFEMKQRALVDVYSIVAPDLTIIDCLIGQSGFQNNRKDCVLAGSDAVALDTVLSAIADIDAKTIESLLLATQYGYGISNPADITMCGDDLRGIMAGFADEDEDELENEEEGQN